MNETTFQNLAGNFRAVTEMSTSPRWLVLLKWKDWRGYPILDFHEMSISAIC